MKIIIQIFLLLLVVSCGEHNGNPEIYGAWQTVKEPKYSHGITDSVVFQAPDSLKIYYIQNEKVLESLFGKFYINKDRSQLVTEFDASKFQFDVIELTNSLLQTRQIGKHATIKYRRLSN
jgi:hypothetical protein